MLAQHGSSGRKTEQGAPSHTSTQTSSNAQRQGRRAHLPGVSASAPTVRCGAAAATTNTSTSPPASARESSVVPRSKPSARSIASGRYCRRGGSAAEAGEGP